MFYIYIFVLEKKGENGQTKTTYIRIQDYNSINQEKIDSHNLYCKSRRLPHLHPVVFAIDRLIGTVDADLLSVSLDLFNFGTDDSLRRLPGEFARPSKKLWDHQTIQKFYTEKLLQSHADSRKMASIHTCADVGTEHRP
jgi:hypothetical protein